MFLYFELKARDIWLYRAGSDGCVLIFHDSYFVMVTDLKLGYRMAQNLRKNLPSSDNLIIHDVNSEATARFAKENSNVQIAEDVRDVAEKAVSCLYPLESLQANPHHLIKLHSTQTR